MQNHNHHNNRLGDLNIPTPVKLNLRGFFSFDFFQLLCKGINTHAFIYETEDLVFKSRFYMQLWTSSLQ